MKESSVVVAEEIPAIGFTYVLELPDKRQLSFQSHVPQTIDVNDFHAVVDKVKAVGDRQFAFMALEALKRQLEQEEKLAYDHAARMAQVDENIKRDWASRNKKGDIQLNSRQEQEQRQAWAHAEESKRRIAKVKKEIAQQEAIISGA